jgi:quinol monooxygenase YgiN
MTTTIEVTSKPGKIAELYQTLQALLPTMRQEKGCKNCRVAQDIEYSEVYVLSSEWDVQASFERYIKSASGIVLIGAINTLGQKTRVQMGGNARWEGGEVLQRIWRED